MQTIIPPIPLGEKRDDEQTGADTDAMITLYDRTVDCVKGYAKMVEKAEPSFRDTAESFRSLHAGHATSLARILSEIGITAEPDGTFMGTINQAVVAFRTFFDDIDEDAMDQIRSGEDWVLKAFDDAIAATPDDGRKAQLHEMRTELTNLLDQTRHLG